MIGHALRIQPLWRRILILLFAVRHQDNPSVLYFEWRGRCYWKVI